MSENKNLMDMFFRKAPIAVIDSLVDGKKTITEIARIGYLTYSHTNKLIHELNELGIINLEKYGRMVYVSLTEEGYEIAKLVRKIEKILNNLKKENKNENGF